MRHFERVKYNNNLKKQHMKKILSLVLIIVSVSVAYGREHSNTTKSVKHNSIIVDKLTNAFLNIRFTSGFEECTAVAKLFPYSNKYDGYSIDKVKFLLSRCYDNFMEPKFVLRIMEKDANTGLPSTEIFKSIVKVDCQRNKGNQKFEYKLPVEIKFPDTGVFVSIEWIASKENQYQIEEDYEFENQSEIDNKAYSPTIISKRRKSVEHNYWQLKNGEWSLSSKEKYSVVPYIELDLVN